MLSQILLPHRLNSQVPYEKYLEVSITSLVSTAYDKSYIHTDTGANTLIRNTTIATITISAITPIIMAPILPNVPIFIQRYSGNKYIHISLGV
jgi:hypothetical protein